MRCSFCTCELQSWKAIIEGSEQCFLLELISQNQGGGKFEVNSKIFKVLVNLKEFQLCVLYVLISCIFGDKVFSDLIHLLLFSLISIPRALITVNPLKMKHLNVVVVFLS